jgi:hypothetical protein
MMMMMMMMMMILDPLRLAPRIPSSAGLYFFHIGSVIAIAAPVIGVPT